MKDITIRSPQDIFSVLINWKGRRQENFIAVTLNGNRKVIKIHHITKGLVNKTIVHPRECFFHAIKDYASAIIFAHNHPSGKNEPSPEDDKLTERLCMSGTILGITVLDHVILTKKDGFYSYRSENKIIDDYPDHSTKEFVASIAAEDYERGSK